MNENATHTFSPPVRAWFDSTFGQPTPPQAEGWPAIQRSEHTLILAPTGMGKTLAAFLWGIDDLYRELTADDKPEPGVRLLYISPLKALNNDVRRNLRTPLAGIRKAAHELDLAFPEIRVAVRSGDTPSRERQAMLRKPPHILITTPESLYLMLTAPKAREMFRQVKTVIVDEIHTLVGTKRGVHLSISLERLANLAETPVQRIGLSATIHPLEEAAYFLGGSQAEEKGSGGEREVVQSSPQPLSPPAPLPRPVTIINAKAPKAFDLRVITPVEDFANLPGDSIWPTLIPQLIDLIRRHKTTLIFCNSRRQAERAANRLNEHLFAEETGQPSSLVAGGVAAGLGLMGSGTGQYPAAIRAHHGSMSREARLEMERDLKEGRLRALVATSSLELGIDIGTIDLVVQLQSPKSVAQGLQRVGRSGHLVGQTSKGRLYATHREDVMEAAAVAGGMLRGQVEPTFTPRNPLDVLAQQIVAMVSVEAWDVDEMFALICRAYPYHELSRSAFNAVLEMLAGRYSSDLHRQLRPRLDWDRVNNRLDALPGARMLALTNGGTISDRGTFAAYRVEGRTKLGELDEEFIYESRIGDTFMLGSQVWRVTDITDDRIMVQEAPGATPRMPFWRGEYAWRPYELGRRIGQFRRLAAKRMAASGGDWAWYRQVWERRDEQAVQALIGWLQADYALDRNSAWQVLDYVAGQLDSGGAISSDQTIVVEIFPDHMGIPQMVVHSPYGGRVNGPWGLALAGALREQTNVNVEAQSSDDGILLRFPDIEADFPHDLVVRLGAAEARELLLRELPDSAVFGAQFRQNAARALLLPGNKPGKRTPFWLQRLKAKDLMQAVRPFTDFPIIIETYRDCLEDVMDLPNLERVLIGIQTGEIEVVVTEPVTPSPLARGLLRQFIDIYLYEWDAPRAERQLQQLAVNRDLLQDVLKEVDLGDLLKPQAIAAVSERLQHTAPNTLARSAAELAVILEQMGDLSETEILKRSALDPAPWLATLAEQGRIRSFAIPTTSGVEPRWVSVHQLAEYEAAFGSDETVALPARRAVLSRYLSHVGPVSTDEIRGRYAFPTHWLADELNRLLDAGQLAHGQFTPDGPTQYLERRNLEEVHRRTLSLLRREVQPVPFAVYADFLARHQRLPQTGKSLPDVLRQLQGVPIIGPVWERDVFPLRLKSYRAADLAVLCQNGEVVWVGSGGSNPKQGRVRFLFRGEGGAFLEPALEDLSTLSDNARTLYSLLKSEGALFLADMQAVLQKPEAKLQAALVELVMACLVTNDSLDTLHHLLETGRRPSPPKAESSLEAQLAERRASSGIPARGLRRPSRTAYQNAKRRVRERLMQDSVLSESETAAGQGRWSLVHRLGVLGKPLSAEEQAARQARQLLHRWGVISRQTLTAEEGAWHWGLLYQHLSLLEMRGEVRRGQFVEGLPGLQFALPAAVESLRARREVIAGEDAPLILLNACDPANLYGPAQVDAPLTFTRRPSTWLVQQRGHPLLVIEGNGSGITAPPGYNDETIAQAVQVWMNHLAHHEHRLSVRTWNGHPVLDSAGQTILESLGFRRDYPGMTWETWNAPRNTGPIP